MKTAILLNGNVRTIEKCKKSILSCFEHLNPDYYVSTYSNQFGYHPCVQNSINFYEDPFLSEQEINNKFFDFKLKSILIDDLEESIKFYEEQKDKFNLNMKNLESSFLQYLKVKKGLELITNLENDNLFKYDTIIKTRCDIQHSNILKEINLVDLNSKLIVSSGNVFPNDCILISCRDNIFKIVNFMVDEFYCYSNSKSNQDDPHGLLLAATEFAGLTIQSYKIMEYVVRANKNQYY